MLAVNVQTLLSSVVVFDLKETLKSYRLTMDFGIKLCDCSIDHLAQVWFLILRFLEIC